MQSRRFGAAWTVHQSLPRYIGAMAASASTREAAALAAYALAEVLPCKYCRRSYRDFARFARLKLRLQDAAGLSRAHHERFYFDVHNLVNAKLDKPVLHTMQPGYNAQTAATGEAFCCALIDWLMMLALNYQVVEPPALQAQLKNVRRAAVVSRGHFFRAARRRDVTLGAIVTAFCDGLVRDSGADVDRAQFDWWRKAAWHIFYMESLIRLMEGVDAPTAVRRCAAALRRRLALQNGDDKIAGDNAEPFANQRALFDALYLARRDCTQSGEVCPPRDVMFAQFDSYRAGRCQNNESPRLPNSSATAANSPTNTVPGDVHDKVVAELSLKEAENKQLRQQLNHQWKALSDLMNQTNVLKAKNELLGEQNEALLATQRSAYKCVEQTSMQTERYRKRAHRLRHEKRALQRHLTESAGDCKRKTPEQSCNCSDNESLDEQEHEIQISRVQTQTGCENGDRVEEMRTDQNESAPYGTTVAEVEHRA